MYSLCIVVVEIRAQRISLGRERNAPVPVVSNALSLDCSVKALDVCIVIGTMEAGVSRLDTMVLESLFEVSPVLWPVVALCHSERKAKDRLGGKDSLSG